MAKPDTINTLERELDYQMTVQSGAMRRGRAQTLQALRQIIQNATELLKELEVTTDNTIISNDRTTLWIEQGTKNLKEGMDHWYQASQITKEMSFLNTLYEKEKVKKP